MRILGLSLVLALAAAGIAAAQAPAPHLDGLFRVYSPAVPEAAGKKIPPAADKGRTKKPPDSLKLYQEALGRWQLAPKMGTGLVVDARGYLLVSSQLIRKRRKLEVEVAPAQWLPARLIGYDDMTDIAVVKVPQHLPVGKLVDYIPKKGEAVTARGFPLGTLGEFSGTIAEPEVPRYFGSLERFYLTDIKPRKGLAGGVLLNSRQEAFGWVPGPDDRLPLPPALARGSEGEPVVYGIAIDRVKTIARAIIAQGSYLRPYLGLKVVERKSGGGLEVMRVIGAGPADRAGMQGGDILLQVGGQSIPDEAWLRRLVFAHKMGDRLVFRVERQGGFLDITVTISNLGREDELRLY